MSIGVKQSVKQTQQLLLSPQIQQAIKLLTLGRLELEEFLSQEVNSNPCLEELDPGTDLGDSNTPLVSELDQPQTEFSQGNDHLESQIMGNETSETQDLRGVDDFLERFTESLSNPQERLVREDEEQNAPAYELFNVTNDTLYEEIETQLKMMHITNYEFECALVILQYLDNNGFLDAKLEAVAEQNNVPLEDLEYALTLVQRCEPTGVGARDVKECLLLQTLALPRRHPLVEKILKDFWPEFEKQDFNKIAKALKVTPEDVKSAIGFIRENLDPRPARQFGDSNNQIVVPDVFIFKREGEWVASLNEDGLPRLKISPKYEKLVNVLSKERKGSVDDRKLKEFVNEKIKDARWLVRALFERNKTILRVAEVLVQRQRDFFEHGLSHLKPLTLKMVAEELGLHESTISRTTTNKYIHSPQGIVELKYFFGAGMNSASGEELSNETIKSWVAEYIKREEGGSPFSDQDIANLIEKEKTVKVARRTIAKYRESLGILPSSKRARLQKV
jgi:RNA polymerase sigma-54 factor